MTTPAISFQPMQVTTGEGLFQLLSGGFIQGFMQPDPAYRYALTQGILASTETVAMIPGAAITDYIPAADAAAGGNVIYATSAATMTGFSVGNQAYNGIITPTASVPVIGSSMSVQFVRFGSNARICVGIESGFAATLSAGSAAVTTQCSWDFVNQQLVPYAPAYSANTITGAVWASTAGGRTTFTVSTDPSAILTAGDVISVSGVVSTGGSGVGFNGTFEVVSTTSSTIVVTQALSASPGTYSSGGTVAAGGGAISVKILAVNAGNSMQIYADDDDLFQWDASGNCALIQI